ncbi:MAG: hypothetical protein IH851_10635 [Armatimonadetes bacterium]|nr:hypothetical protein [Armatimonadota bacterium]
MNDSLNLLLAFEISVFWIPIIAIVGGFLVSIVRMLIGHQQKMTELIQRQRENAALADRVHALEAHLADLTEKVNQKTLPPDDDRSSSRD